MIMEMNPLEPGQNPPFAKKQQAVPGLESALDPWPDYGLDAYQHADNPPGKRPSSAAVAAAHLCSEKKTFRK
jgi:hypothetical protein